MAELSRHNPDDYELAASIPDYEDEAYDAYAIRMEDWLERGYDQSCIQDQYALISSDAVMIDWVWAESVEDAWDMFEERNEATPEDDDCWVTNLTAVLS